MRTWNVRHWLHGNSVLLTLMLSLTLSSSARAGDSKPVSSEDKKAKKAQPLQTKDLSKQVPDQGLTEFSPRPGRFVQKVKRGWSGLLIYSGTIDGVDWQIVESQGIGATNVNSPDGTSASEYFPSHDPVLQLVSFDISSRFNAVRKGTAMIRYLGRADSGLSHCELRIEVEADTSELDAALKEAIPLAQIKVIEVRSAAIFKGTVPTEEDLALAMRVGQQFYNEIIPQLKVAAAEQTSKGAASNDSTKLSPAKPDQETPRKPRPVAQEELKVLREEVQGLRQDIRQLNELLRKRLESKDRAELDPPKIESSESNKAIRDGLLCFDATWCGPCAQMRPIVQRLKRKGSPIQFVDVDAKPGLCKQYNVESIPCFILLKDGKEIDRSSGITTEENLRALLKRLDTETRNHGVQLGDPVFVVSLYPVADLVFPIVAEPGGGEPKPKPNDWFRLIEMIMTEVEPTCWVSNGGACTIKANESTNSLLVRAPRSIQEQVQAVFRHERRKMDLQVCFAVTLIAAPDKPLAELTRADLKTDPDSGCVLLDQAKAKLLVDALQAGGARIEMSPKLTIFNGQTAFLGSKSWPVRDDTFIDFSLQMRGFVAPDQRSVGVNLALNPDKIVDELTRRTINVADGSSLLMDMTEELRAKNPDAAISGRAYMLLQPRIIIQQEEEERSDLPVSTNK